MRGSTEPNGISTSAFRAQPATRSSIELGAWSNCVRASMVNTTAAIRPSRYTSAIRSMPGVRSCVLKYAAEASKNL